MHAGAQRLRLPGATVVGADHIGAGSETQNKVQDHAQRCRRRANSRQCDCTILGELSHDHLIRNIIQMLQHIGKQDRHCKRDQLLHHGTFC